MSIELEQRLQRRAPDVDIKPARTANRARRGWLRLRRRSLVAGALAVATSCGGAVVMTNTGSDRDESVFVRGEDQPTTLPNIEQVTTATQAGIEISVTTREQVRAGSRLWFDVVVRNGSDAAVFWQAGGCAIPVTGALGPESRVSLDAAPMDDARWNGQVDSLGAWLAEHNTFSGLLGEQPENATAVRELFCTSDSRLAAIEPGQAVHYRGSVEVRAPPGPLLNGGSYALVVGFQPYATPGGYPDDPMALVTVRAPVNVIDDPERGSEAAAISAFAATAGLRPGSRRQPFRTVPTSFRTSRPSSAGGEAPGSSRSPPNGRATAFYECATTRRPPGSSTSAPSLGEMRPATSPTQ